MGRPRFARRPFICGPVQLVCVVQSVGISFGTFRSSDEKRAHPERLNLDRRKLGSCPLLEGEQHLKLLNYQNNLISSPRSLPYMSRGIQTVDGVVRVARRYFILVYLMTLFPYCWLTCMLLVRVTSPTHTHKQTCFFCIF